MLEFTDVDIIAALLYGGAVIESTRKENTENGRVRVFFKLGGMPESDLINLQNKFFRHGTGDLKLFSDKQRIVRKILKGYGVNDARRQEKDGYFDIKEIKDETGK